MSISKRLEHLEQNALAQSGACPACGRLPELIRYVTRKRGPDGVLGPEILPLPTVPPNPCPQCRETIRVIEVIEPE